MINVDVQTVIIVVLVAFIAGMLINRDKPGPF
jgi:hypothetical protein